MHEYQRVERLIEILTSRGLKIDDEATAAKHLSLIGHHRLSAFYHAFYNGDDSFDQEIPVTIVDVAELYAFDRRLRLHLSGPLEKIEVALRALIVKEVGDRSLSEEGAGKRSFELFATKYYDLNNTRRREAFKITKNRTYQQAKAFWMAKYWPRIKKNIVRDNGGQMPPQRQLKQIIKQKFNDYYFALPPWEVLQKVSFGVLVSLYDSTKFRPSSTCACYNLLCPKGVKKRMCSSRACLELERSLLKSNVRFS